jgi:hypothetical protein
MAGDVGGVDPSQTGFLAAMATTVGAAVGAFGLWVANRLLGKAAIQAQLNTSFKEFTDQLQEERRELLAERTAERLAWAARDAQLRGEIINLIQTVESLKALLRRNGIDVPEVHRPAPDFDVIPGGGEK